MAREGKYLHADALLDAIQQASGMFDAPIERVEVVGRKIVVSAGGRRAVFRIVVSESVDPESRAPLIGGITGRAVLEDGPGASWWGRLRGRQRGA